MLALIIPNDSTREPREEERKRQFSFPHLQAVWVWGYVNEGMKPNVFSQE